MEIYHDYPNVCMRAIIHSFESDIISILIGMIRCFIRQIVLQKCGVSCNPQSHKHELRRFTSLCVPSGCVMLDRPHPHMLLILSELGAVQDLLCSWWMAEAHKGWSQQTAHWKCSFVFVHVDIANISRAGGQTRPVMKPQINGSRRVGGTPKVTWHWGPDVYFYLWEGVENQEQRDCLPQMLATSF